MDTMEVVNNYKDYKKYLPEYASWRDKQDLERERRLVYLQRNPDKINSHDIERGKNLLHAIDVMDEYSQANAEDMEVATDFATGQIVGLATMLGMIAGFPFANTKAIKNLATKLAKNDAFGVRLILEMLPTAIGMLAGIAVSFPAIVWATKAQVSASRKGRFEAMRKDLSNPASFAALTPEQRKKAEEDAKSIELEDREKQRIEINKGLGANPFKAFKTLKKYFAENGEYSKQKAEFDAALKNRERQFNKSLTPEQIKNAKRDQQILSDIVRRMDVASQDYAENTELATNTLTTIALGTGGLVGWLSNKLLKFMKVKNGFAAKVVPWAVGAAVPVVMGIYSAQVQKHSSRIGRFKVRQEMLKNPASLVYVDKTETDKMTDVKLPQRAKKPNIFKFFIQLVKDNKEYQKYRKTKAVEDMKFHKAVEKLQLTPEQLKEAKALQMNVFNTFNKVDEKSQVYSESVEAMGEITKQGVSTFGSLGALGISTAMMFNIFKNPETSKQSGIVKSMLKVLSPYALVILPVIGLDIYTTKVQKKASRVADMLALKELEDYRHYADYS